MNESVVVVTMANAQQILIEESHQRPVVIDFWAEWCAPCKTLMPMLERLAAEYAGQFLLAKVDCDVEQQIAAQFGVRSLPTVVVMKDGQPVDGFSGAQPEAAVRQLLEKFLPKPWDLLTEQARVAMAEGDPGTALTLLSRAYEESRRQAPIALELARVLIGLKRFDEAQSTLDGVRLADRDALHQQLVAQLELERAAAKTPEIQALEQQMQARPDDLDVAYQLAVQYNQSQHHREALELLIGVLRRQRDHTDARKALLDIIAVLGNADPLAKEYQRRLFSLLY